MSLTRFIIGVIVFIFAWFVTRYLKRREEITGEVRDVFIRGIVSSVFLVIILWIFNVNMNSIRDLIDTFHQLYSIIFGRS